jgi:hypothetical protein
MNEAARHVDQVVVGGVRRTVRGSLRNASMQLPKLAEADRLRQLVQRRDELERELGRVRRQIRLARDEVRSAKADQERADKGRHRAKPHGLLSVRAVGVIRNNGIPDPNTSPEQAAPMVAALGERELWRSSNCGPKTIAEIQRWLATFNLSLSE